MIRFATTLLFALLLVNAAGRAAPTGAESRGCDGYATQEAAQAALDADLTDPGRLDTDFDGFACDPDQPRPAAPDAPGFGSPDLQTAGAAPLPVVADQTQVATTESALASTDGIPAGAVRARVVRVIDGDTITVEIDDPDNVAFGQTRTVRLAGIAAGASAAGGSSCFAAESAGRIDVMLPAGRTVYLESESADSAERYVWFKGKDDGESHLANEILVREGFAVVVAPSASPHHPRLSAAQTEATAAGAGLWTTCPEAAAPGSASA